MDAKGEFGSLSKTRSETAAFRLTEGDKIEEVKPRMLRPGDRVLVKAGQVIPGDGEIMRGTAAIDESAVTGESAPVICDAEGVRTSVSGGTLVVSGQIMVRITSGARTKFLDRIILLVGGSRQQPKARSITSRK
jgi:K+-transporting ATPase ATPase B chain